jgi:hypothetical protein
MLENDTIENFESNGFLQKKTDIIYKSNTRILRPYECKLLVDNIPKLDYVNKFEALLYSGMRYIEVQRLYRHPEWFNGEIIHLTKKAIKKKKATVSERYVHLNPVGRRAVSHFLKSKTPLPDYSTWRENLKRWMINAKLYPDYMSPKTTRKTYESWLVTYYPEKFNQIFLSQGHNQLTALRHYLNLPFTEKDKLEMKTFVDGWI